MRMHLAFGDWVVSVHLIVNIEGNHSQSLVPKPSAPVSSENLIEMYLLSSHHRLPVSNLCFSKPSRRFWCQQKFVNHCSDTAIQSMAHGAAGTPGPLWAMSDLRCRSQDLHGNMMPRWSRGSESHRSKVYCRKVTCVRASSTQRHVGGCQSGTQWILYWFYIHLSSLWNLKQI